MARLNLQSTIHALVLHPGIVAGRSPDARITDVTITAVLEKSDHFP
ncbi:MAG TPA: hypothetical protein VKH81_19880 [Candidatus Angelobacter sp.]|nr:hypothetical protein [Candidatus Angelobacter sp.]